METDRGEFSNDSGRLGVLVSGRQQSLLVVGILPAHPLIGLLHLGSQGAHHSLL